MTCELCKSMGGALLHEDHLLRIVRLDTNDYPGYCRVVWLKHVPELSDLTRAEQERLMAAVIAVEQAIRTVLAPDKINLASLGNQVPHLHWHVIPRWTDDPCFPDSIWSQSRRTSPRRSLPPGWQARLRDLIHGAVTAMGP